VEGVVAALAGAALGFALSFIAAERSFRRARDIAEADVARQELAVLEGLTYEIEVCLTMAVRISPTPLPVAYLHEAIPLCRHMNQAQLDDFQNYWQAVLRYNGRVDRLIAYGAAKRARGESPGSEKPRAHAVEVVLAVPAAYSRVRDLANDRRTRLAEDRPSTHLRVFWPFSKSTVHSSEA
jgi:hypothetical protein